MAKGSNRLLVKQRFSSPRRKLPSYGSKGAVLVSRTLTGSPLIPVPGHQKKPCIPSKGKALGKSACRSELVFTPGGLRLRLCSSKGKAGPVIPVASPSEATRASREFCACVKKTKNAKACALKVGKGAPLGRYRR